MTPTREDWPSRSITKRSRGRSLGRVAAELRSYLLGWKGCFQLAATPKVFRGLDQWIRHGLRAFQLNQWKRGTTVFRELRARGASKELAARIAANARRCWRNSARKLHMVIPNAYFDQLGVPRLAT